LALVGFNTALVLSNRDLQEQVNARAQYIQQTQTIRALYEDIVKALANLAVERNDQDIKALLAQQGFTINPPAVRTPPAADAGKGKIP
jgi:NH3-dependent NAD+ synthetase